MMTLEKTMKKYLVGIGIMLLGCAPASSQSFRALTPLGQQVMSSLSAATNLPSVPNGTLEAFIVCETQNVRWRDDGMSPTASVGALLLPSQPFPYIGSMSRIQIIQTTTSASCTVTYYG